MSSMVGKGPTGYGQGGNSTGMKEKIPSGYSKASIKQFTPEQMQMFQSAFGHLGPDSFLSKLAGGDESAFQEMERPAFRQFNEMMGGLSSRFSGMGMGARNSSGFQNSASAAAGNFAQDLASKRSQMRMQAIKELMGMSNDFMKLKPYENALVEQGPNPWAAGAGALGGGALGFFGSGGNPYFALQGAKLGLDVGKAF